MSKEGLPQDTRTEEVDLGTLFNAIGKLFDRILNFIYSIFKLILSVIVHISKAVIDNFKVIAAIILLAFLAGYGLEKMSKPKYSSTMVVRTYFDAKYQLLTNLNYYNSLLSEENYDALAEVFEVEPDILKSVKSFEIEPGPESENDRILEFDEFLKSLDSVRRNDITYEDYLENRDLLSGDIFQISVVADQRRIFKPLETGVFKSFDNVYSTKKRQKRDSMIQIRRQNILSSIEEIDSLKKVYINVLQDESKATRTKISLVEGGFPLQQEKTDTREYQLLNKEIELNDELRKLDEQKLEQNEFFDVISGFQYIGNKVDSIYTKYRYIFPLLAIVLLFLYYISVIYVRFVKKYEG